MALDFGYNKIFRLAYRPTGKLNSFGETRLILACKTGEKRAVTYLVERFNFDVNQTGIIRMLPEVTGATDDKVFEGTALHAAISFQVTMIWFCIFANGTKPTPTQLLECVIHHFPVRNQIMLTCC